MLRRVAKVLRVSLALAGLLLLAWMPVTFFVVTAFSSPWPISFGGMSGEGTLSLTVVAGLDVAEFSVQFFEPTGHRFGWRHYLLPGFGRNPMATSIWFPMWLLAAVCLAWPVTSFIVVRRRRRGRGFEVEATGGGAVADAAGGRG